MKTSGNTVLITGGGSGIGLALTEALVRRGNRVIICGRRRDRLKAVQARVPGVSFRVCDISRTRSRHALVDWLLSEFNRLNILINNAGIQRQIDFLKGPRDLREADEEVTTNLVAPIHLSAQLVPHLRKKKEAAIVNISSGLAFTPLAVVPVYCATKAAVHSWSLSLRHQLRNTSVRVFEVAPPMVATELAGERNRPEAGDFVMSAEAVAAGVLEALGMDQYEVALGAATNLRAKREALFSAINQ
ncbi:MAG: SDR family NAD(P)-dependent oxidoreductase [candidate division Zixibacteria bacterium]|nr:SDR family NAD(P)-dependent oxidoreductase [candidate division Zixibacteria bacterium]